MWEAAPPAEDLFGEPKEPTEPNIARERHVRSSSEYQALAARVWQAQGRLVACTLQYRDPCRVLRRRLYPEQ